MALTINANPSASTAALNLSKSNMLLRKSLDRLSSGKRIVNPADDAGGLAVSMKLSAIAKRTGAASRNVGNAISYAQVQDGALATTASILDRMSELRAMTDDITKNTSDVANYNVEFQQLREQLNNIASEKFNGISLFSAGGTQTFGATALTGSTLAIYTTEQGSSSTISISLAKSALVSALHVKGVTNSGNTINTATFNATNSLAGTSDGTASIGAFAVNDLIAAIENVATLRANNGAVVSRLQFAQDQLNTNKTNIESANSRIIDTDIATESTAFARYNILVQSGASMLSQANSLSNVALALLG